MRKHIFKISIASAILISVIVLFYTNGYSYRIWHSPFMQAVIMKLKAPKDAPHGTCNSCHISHTTPGVQLTMTQGNANLCMSCHNPAGSASAKPFTAADNAVPGTGGNSHGWDRNVVSAAFEANAPTNSLLLSKVVNDTIICSTCHNQHSQDFPPFLRDANTSDALCKDCHSARNIARYADNPANKGSHPVGISMPAANPFYFTAPQDSMQLVNSKIECSSCHKIHFAASNDGYLLRQTNNMALCQSCHKYQDHKGMGCKDCHQTHNTDKTNIYLVQSNLTTPASGVRTVNFSAESGANSFADGDATYNGVCEVCHTSVVNYHQNGSGGDHTHYAGQNCTTNCHKHEDDFTVNCLYCHDQVQGPRRIIVGVGGDFERYSHHIGNAARPKDCATCHYMKDHRGGIVKLHDADDRTVVYTYNAGAPDTLNGFCISCHDGDGAQDPLITNGTPFYDGVTPPSVDETLWNASAHGTAAQNIGCMGDGSSTGCHGNGHGSNKSNMLSLFDKTADGSADPMDEEEELCLSCHGGGGVATVQVHLAFSSYTNTGTGFYKHDPEATYRLHDKNENTGAAFASGGNRHVECVDCHNPHAAKTGTATAPALLPSLTGASGVDPAYSGIGAPTGFTWLSNVTYEYQVCFKCHSSFTTLPSYSPDGWDGSAFVANGLLKLTTGGINNQIADKRDMAEAFNPANGSHHAVMAAGTNANISASTFQAGYTFASRLYCTSCHNNSGSATAGQGKGPHGSANIHILDKGFAGVAQYKTIHNDAIMASTNEVCTKCHKSGSYYTASTASRFNKHKFHVDQKVQCYVCHNTHGSEQFHLINFNRNDANCLTGFGTTYNSQTAYKHALYNPSLINNGCIITCHGIDHSDSLMYYYKPSYAE